MKSPTRVFIDTPLVAARIFNSCLISCGMLMCIFTISKTSFCLVWYQYTTENRICQQKIENNSTKYGKSPKVKYSTVLDRIQNLTNTTPTVGDLAKITGLTEKNLYARRSYDREFSEDEIQLINAHFNINLYKDNENAENTTVDYYPDILVSCGNGIFQLNETKEKITIPKALIKGYSEAQKYIVVTAFSDSMQPEIKEKDLLIVRTTDGEEIQDNHIYMFSHDGRFYCKYLSYNLGQLIVRSANPEYPTRHIEKEDLQNFELIGEIVGLMRDLR